MLRLVTPNLQLDNVLELSADRLRELGMRSLLLDVDCTLKDYRADAIGGEVQDWLKTLLADRVSLCIFSNGKARRIGPLATRLGIPFIAKAYKPLPFRCRRALDSLKFDRKHTAVVGDQLFADILAGRLAGLFTILVRPTTSDEPWFTRLKRPLERRVLRRINQPQYKTLTMEAADRSSL